MNKLAHGALLSAALNLENDTDNKETQKETVIPNELILGRETGKK